MMPFEILDRNCLNIGRGAMGMSDRAPAPQPPIFSLQAFSPAEIKEAVEKVGVKKAHLSLAASLMLAVVAGGGVGFGALYYTIIASDPTLGFAATRLLGGSRSRSVWCSC
ncbi:hypothetical protein ACTGJ9_016410 [Bradyrhizobium sp. RDM12]